MDFKPFTTITYGMYIVATKDDDKFCGCIVNSIVQVTADTKKLAICVHKDNYTNAKLKESKELSICVLKENEDPKVFGTFGYRSSKDVDKFANIDVDIVQGLPVYKNSCAYFTCKITDTVEVDTHTIFIAQVDEANYLSDDKPMTYDYYHKVIKLKSPKNAPSFAG